MAEQGANKQPIKSVPDRETVEAGMRMIHAELEKLAPGPRKEELSRRLQRIQQTEARDLLF